MYYVTPEYNITMLTFTRKDLYKATFELILKMNYFQVLLTYFLLKKFPIEDRKLLFYNSMGIYDSMYIL